MNHKVQTSRHRSISVVTTAAITTPFRADQGDKSYCGNILRPCMVRESIGDPLETAFNFLVPALRAKSSTLRSLLTIPEIKVESPMEALKVLHAVLCQWGGYEIFICSAPSKCGECSGRRH